MTTVAQVLNAKPVKTIFSTAPETSVFDAVGQMADRNVGALVVLDGDCAIGLVSERDYARKVVLLARSSRDTVVRTIMSAATTVRPSQTVEECMALMTEKRLRHLLVMEAGKLRGLISIGDLVRQVIEDQQYAIEQLESYVHGKQA